MQVQADCGCGMRCQKYTSDLQCGRFVVSTKVDQNELSPQFRCCTATVRRSVPFERFEEDAQQKPQETSVQEKLQATRKRSFDELTSILSLLEQKERRSTSKHVRAEIHRTRKRLQRYGQLRYGDFMDNNTDDSDRSLNSGEKEMYDVLERIIRRLVQQHHIDEDVVEKRSIPDVAVPARRTTAQRLSQLFRL